jgi:hypothetical protein
MTSLIWLLFFIIAPALLILAGVLWLSLGWNSLSWLGQY